MSRKWIVIVAAAAVCCVFAVLLVRFFTARGAVRPAQVAGAPAIPADLRALEDSGDLVAAKAAYQKLVADYPNRKEVADWQRRAEALNIKIIFSPVITPQSVQYEIKPGDSLEKIAREHKTTVEMIKKANAIAEDRIYPGMKIKVWNAPFTILVDKSSNLLLLKSNEEVIKTYTVSTGTNNCTPTGNFKIIEKIVNPPWYKNNKRIPYGDPENILGTRWMGIDKEGYGIHGTTDPKSLGKQATAGCVRMSNQDVEELFSIVPQGTQVTIEN
jgi:lipoprotein-anchoring transpeptidase ErfK/SrfK